MNKMTNATSFVSSSNCFFHGLVSSQPSKTWSCIHRLLCLLLLYHRLGSDYLRDSNTKDFQRLVTAKQVSTNPSPRRRTKGQTATESNGRACHQMETWYPIHHYWEGIEKEVSQPSSNSWPKKGGSLNKTSSRTSHDLTLDPETPFIRFLFLLGLLILRSLRIQESWTKKRCSQRRRSSMIIDNC